MENHQSCFEQNWWLNKITIDYFSLLAGGLLFYISEKDNYIILTV